MAEFKLTPPLVRQEIIARRRRGGAGGVVDRDVEWLQWLQREAASLPGGYVKKIVWGEEDGYPEHAWGFVQWTVRPFVQGYGCDGTTDRNVHLVALTLCGMLGIDYQRCYRDAYADNDYAWIDALPDDASLVEETRLPAEPSLDAIVLMLADLEQINNRSLVAVLAGVLEEWDLLPTCYWERKDAAKARVRAVIGAGLRA
ncbi:hypothetical protein [Acidovorax sp. SDU_ACID1]|uniref:hypothetical protein n=1 Tax=Acidovorax sp. SDU_ACID1 TaxID=3136632 RepID=UPI003873A83E